MIAAKESFDVNLFFASLSGAMEKRIFLFRVGSMVRSLMLPKSIGYGSLAAAMLGTLLRIYAQQAPASPNSNHPDDQSPAPTASTTATPTTVDGIAACPGNWKSQVLPEGVFRVGNGVKTATGYEYSCCESFR